MDWRNVLLERAKRPLDDELVQRAIERALQTVKGNVGERDFEMAGNVIRDSMAEVAVAGAYLAIIQILGIPRELLKSDSDEQAMGNIERALETGMPLSFLERQGALL